MKVVFVTTVVFVSAVQLCVAVTVVIVFFIVVVVKCVLLFSLSLLLFAVCCCCFLYCCCCFFIVLGSRHEGFCGLSRFFTKNQSSRVPASAWQEYLGLSRQILASFRPRSRWPMCQRQADQVDMIMFRPGDPLNFSWHSPGVSQAGGWRVAGAIMFLPGIG